MRAILSRLACSASLTVSLIACGGGGNDVDPRIIPGGGIGDGEIDGELNLYVIDSDTDLPVAATVAVGDLASATVDATGLLVIEELEGPQTIAVKATGYRSAVWVGANGANVTIPLSKLVPATVGQATLSGTIAGFDGSADPGHVAAAITLYSQTDDLGDPENELVTPNNMNFCGGGPTCAWSLVSRTGTLHVMAAILDIDGNGTPTDQTDDIISVTGWASKAVTVEDGVNQSGLVLDMIEAGNLDTVTVDLGTPPAALTEEAALVGIEIADDEVVQIPISSLSDTASMLAPKLSAFPGSTYRLTAIAQTTSGEDGAQSILLRRGQTSTALAAGTWLVPPTGVQITRTTATWTPVAGAVIHNIAWRDITDKDVLEISVLDNTITTVTVPTLVALPATGSLTGRVGGIEAALDPKNFSLETDIDALTGIATEPVAIQ